MISDPGVDLIQVSRSADRSFDCCEDRIVPRLMHELLRDDLPELRQTADKNQ
jgi:hypothetical protein